MTDRRPAARAMAAPEVGHAALIVTGTLILTSPVPRVAYRQVLALGLVPAPHGGEAALGARATASPGPALATLA